jgi:hypothetical protein
LGALDRPLAGPVTDGIDQIQASGIVLPGIGDQHLGWIETDADLHRAAAQVPALDQGE